MSGWVRKTLASLRSSVIVVSSVGDATVKLSYLINMKKMGFWNGMCQMQS